MARSDILIVDGHAFSWQRLCELRRQQLEERKKAEARQLALFELRTDCRPRAERTAADRYREPSLLDGIAAERQRTGTHRQSPALIEAPFRAEQCIGLKSSPFKNLLAEPKFFHA